MITLNQIKIKFYLKNNYINKNFSLSRINLKKNEFLYRCYSSLGLRAFASGQQIFFVYFKLRTFFYFFFILYTHFSKSFISVPLFYNLFYLNNQFPNFFYYFSQLSITFLNMHARACAHTYSLSLSLPVSKQIDFWLPP